MFTLHIYLLALCVYIQCVGYTWWTMKEGWREVCDLIDPACINRRIMGVVVSGRHVGLYNILHLLCICINIARLHRSAAPCPLTAIPPFRSIVRSPPLLSSLCEAFFRRGGGEGVKGKGHASLFWTRWPFIYIHSYVYISLLIGIAPFFQNRYI